MHKFIIAGRISKVPELIDKGNYKKAHLNISSNKTVKKGEAFEQVTVWNNVTVFGKQAENCAKYLQKGQYVLTEGSIETVKKDTGYISYFTADKVEFGPKVTAKRDSETSEETTESDVPF
jgi:single-strand DNA-binding protein